MHAVTVCAQETAAEIVREATRVAMRHPSGRGDSRYKTHGRELVFRYEFNAATLAISCQWTFDGVDVSAVRAVEIIRANIKALCEKRDRKESN